MGVEWGWDCVGVSEYRGVIMVGGGGVLVVGDKIE